MAAVWACALCHVQAHKQQTHGALFLSIRGHDFNIGRYSEKNAVPIKRMAAVVRRPRRAGVSQAEAHSTAHSNLRLLGLATLAATLRNRTSSSSSRNPPHTLKLATLPPGTLLYHTPCWGTFRHTGESALGNLPRLAAAGAAQSAAAGAGA